MDGVLTRWPEPVPASSPDPVKLHAVPISASIPMRRKSTLNLFDDTADEAPKLSNMEDVDLDNLGEELEDDDWILDDLGGGLKDDNEAHRTGQEVREMGK